MNDELTTDAAERSLEARLRQLASGMEIGFDIKELRSICLEAANALSERPKPSDDIARIGKAIREQDNRITEAPIFAVQQRHRIWGVEEGDGHEWRSVEEWDPVSDAKAEEMEEHFDCFLEAPDGYARIAYVDTWEFVTACFTEAGCKEYIRINGHNLTDPRIYAYGSYRNAEWRMIRQWLLNGGT